jgi:hypothetical protein
LRVSKYGSSGSGTMGDHVSHLMLLACHRLSSIVDAATRCLLLGSISGLHLRDWCYSVKHAVDPNARLARARAAQSELLERPPRTAHEHQQLEHQKVHCVRMPRPWLRRRLQAAVLRDRWAYYVRRQAVEELAGAGAEASAAAAAAAAGGEVASALDSLQDAGGEVLQGLRTLAELTDKLI